MDTHSPFCFILLDTINACHEFDSFPTTVNTYNANRQSNITDSRGT